MIEEDYYDDYDDDYYDDYEDDGYYEAPKPAKPKPAPKPSSKKNAVASSSVPKKTVPDIPKPTTANQQAPKASTSVGTKKSSDPNNISVQTGTSVPATAPNAIVKETPAILKNQSSKDFLTIVILGHVDAGKSTLTGHLLYHKENSHKKVNYAWLLDEDEQEREHGITMDIATKQFETKRHHVVICDAPGHKDYVPAMITGTASADAALLVVDATDFGTSFHAGQLKEHIYLAKGLGVNQVVVCVNKMDVLAWNQDAFDHIKSELTTFLIKLGYTENKMAFVPASGLTGVNVFPQRKPNDQVRQELALLRSWYGEDGKTVLDAMDDLQPAGQLVKLLDKPLRMTVTDVSADQGKGVAIRAKLLQGWLERGEKLVVLPVGDEAVVHKLASLIGSEGERANYAAAGETVDLVLAGIDVSRVSVGNILGRPNFVPSLATKFIARVYILEGLSVPIIPMAQTSLHVQQLDIPCHLSKLLQTLKKDGSVLKDRPRALTSNAQAVVELTLSLPVAMEAFSDCRGLGRFVLRRRGDSVAVGRIEKVLK